MSSKQYMENYMTLVEKLMDFMAENGKIVKKLPRDASFVAFSSENSKLNKYSQKILDSLLQSYEDKPIVKAEQQPKSPDKWKFTTVTTP